jgi:hypothetical protein
MRPPLVAVVVLCAALLVPADAAVAAPARECRELGTKRWKLRAISAEGTTCTAARREAQAYAALETDSAELGRPGTYNVNDYGCRAWRVSRSPRALRVRCVADPMPGATDPPQGTVRFTMYRRSGVS